MLDRGKRKRQLEKDADAEDTITNGEFTTPPPLPTPEPGIDPESNIGVSARVDLRHFFEDQDLFEALCDEAAARRASVVQIMQSAVADYLRSPEKKRVRHDYAPHPSCAVAFRVDHKTFCELELLAVTLHTYIEHAAYIALRRYLDQKEKLEIVDVKTGPRTTAPKVRPV